MGIIERFNRDKTNSQSVFKGGMVEIRLYDSTGHPTAIDPDSVLGRELRDITEEAIYLSKKTRKTRL